MKKFLTDSKRKFLIAILGGFMLHGAAAEAQTNDAIRIVTLGGAGQVEFLAHGAAHWQPVALGTRLDPFDRVRTGTNSSVGIRWSADNVLRFEALTELEILPPDALNDDHGLNLVRGLLYFFHRGPPGRIRVITSGALAGINGTEFVLAVAPKNGVEQTTVSVLEGRVSFGNAAGSLELTNDQQAVAEPGRAPRRTAGFIAPNLLQWCFYYPGVLDLNDLPSAIGQKNSFTDSVADYRAGDVLAALATFPVAPSASSESEKMYHAALLLNGGQINAVETELSARAAAPAAETFQRLGNALRMLIAAVKHEPFPSTFKPQLATEFLAASYYAQSQAGPKSLEQALQFARQAVEKSPEFGFGWERVAELEFSFGRTERAAAALENALRFSPRNAEALSLKGFLLAAQNKTPEALRQFDRALAVDSGLGNAWLGRGLCHIRRGEIKAGREDLLIAAAMEPQRATLRSYLGKAFGEAGDATHATHELNLAKQLDPHDPTAWLYSALLHEQNFQVNDAVRDLEKSQELNQNRGVYRSDLLLDQDRAVRSANLARIYGEAGLDDVALREASRAVSADYGNYSAHLFLAESYQQLRNSSPFDLRYETPAFSEYLVASLLGPADGRILAQPVSQQEYTHLFDRDSYGFSSSTEYLSRGAFSQYLAHYGTQGNFSYALESDYNWDPGQTPNGSQESRQFSLKIKEQLTPNNGLFFEILDFHQDSGDLSQRYNPALAHLGFKTREKQEPSVLAGLDHKWSEHQHTLLLASVFNDNLAAADPNGSSYLFKSSLPGDPPFNFAPVNLAYHYASRLTLGSFEVQHLATFDRFQTVAGIRLQAGTFHLSNQQSVSPLTDFADLFYFPDDLVTNQSLEAHSIRVTPYLYEYWHLTSKLCLIGGLTYDYQSLPQNPLFGPLGNQDRTQQQLSPKAGLVWQPTDHSAVRAAYSQSLGGASLDQSVRLEPTQVGGFVQAYRTLVPGSIMGGISGERFETFDVSIENRFGSGTYLSLAAQLLHSTDRQSVGAYSQALGVGGSAVQVAEQLAFTERSLDFSAHQLLGKYFSVGARYRLSDAHLDTLFPEISPSLGNNRTSLGGLLQLISLHASFQHPGGFFASVEGQGWHQELRGNLAALPGDDFWQANALIGYRSPRRHFEVSLGLLNFTGQDYHLHPINLYPDLQRQRTLVTRLQINF